MKSPFFFYLLASVIMTLSSCSSAYYPSVVNAPVFEDEKELTLSGHWGNSGIDLQSAYTPSNHLGLISNLNFSNPELSDIIESDNRHFLMEAGLGYYSKLSDLLHFSCYGGGGLSYYNRNDDDFNDSRQIRGNYLKFFFQPSLGLVRDHFKGQYILRIVSARIMDDSRLINGIMIEPALNLEFGSGNYQYILQGGASIPTEHIEEISSISNIIFFSIGWKYHFNLGNGHEKKNK